MAMVVYSSNLQPEPRPLGGRYRLIQPLGSGGFGQTFSAQDLHLPGHHLCVVKQLKPQVTTVDEMQVARRLFDTEAQTLYRLGGHPQIPALLAHFEEDQEFYLAQEFIEGHALTDELDAPWTEAQVIAFLGDLLGILAVVHHHGVIHRDIKPSNLIRRASDRRIVLIDFGAVKQVSTQLTGLRSGLSQTISIGTQGYMPSEQVAGRPQFSSDIYAVGVLGIQALTGYAPNQLEPDPHSGELAWQRYASQAHATLVEVLDTMVRYDFRTRYATAAEALAALNSLPPTLNRYIPAALSQGQALHRTQASPTVAMGRRREGTHAPAPQASAQQRETPPSTRLWPMMAGATVAIVALFGGLAWQSTSSTSVPVAPPVTAPASSAEPEPEATTPPPDGGAESVAVAPPEPMAPGTTPALTPSPTSKQTPTTIPAPQPGVAGRVLNPPQAAQLIAAQPEAQINLRTQPSADSTAKGYGLMGDPVLLLRSTQGSDGTWYYVKFEHSGAEGWIRAESVAVAPPEPTAPGTMLNPSQAAQLIAAQPEARINLRSQPSTDSAAKGYGLVGDPVLLLRSTQGSDGTWYYVKFEHSGAEGWIRSDFINTAGRGGPLRP